MKTLWETFTSTLNKLLGSTTYVLLGFIFLIVSAAMLLNKISVDQWLTVCEWIIGGGTVRGTAVHFTKTTPGPSPERGGDD